MSDVQQKSILIIEDDKDITFALTEFLESEGYKIFAVENGQLALDLLKKVALPNLILLDMMMPVMNGWQFALEFVSKFDHLCSFIVMTAAADAKTRAEEVRAADWIEKPFELDRVLELIKKYERK